MFLRNSFVICIVFICGASLASETTVDIDLRTLDALPTSIPTCKQSDSNLNACLVAAFQELSSRLKDGLPELDIPSLDPFVIERTSFAFNDGLVQGRAILKNIRFFGISNLAIDKIDFNLKNDHMRMEQVAHIPNLYVEGYYKSDLKLNDIKMTPKGYFNITMTDVRLTSHPEGDIYEDDDGRSYLKLTKFDASPEVGDMQIYANGIFPDPTLNAIMLDFINQYWRSIYKAVLPSARATWEPLLVDAANEFLSKVPIDLFLTKH